MPSIDEVLTAEYFTKDNKRASWRFALEQEFSLSYMRLLRRRLRKEKEMGHVIYPKTKKIYEALNRTALQDVKVVIVGQDPFPQPGRAHGLAFSVANGNRHGSLGNIIAEVERDIGSVPENYNGCLIPWAEQGVLLLNTVLTVRQGCPGKHKDWGWECFTTRIIQTINREREHIVFMLWGKEAQEKIPAIDWHRHKLLVANHPVAPNPTRPFPGCSHFSRANSYLAEHGQTQICWQNVC